MPAFEIGLWNGWIFMIFLILLSYIPRLTRTVNDPVFKKLGDSEMPLIEAEKRLSQTTTLLFFVSSIYSFFLPLELGTAWFYAGLVIFFIGVIFEIKAMLDFSNTPVDKAVTSGIYRISRNPLYLGMFFVFIATAIACASWIFLILTIVFMILTNISVNSEERFCLDRYGQAYREYMIKTPRWIGLPKTKKK